MPDSIFIRHCRVAQGPPGRLSISLHADAGAHGSGELPGDATLLAGLQREAGQLAGRPLHARHPALNEAGPFLHDASRRAVIGALEAVRLDAVSRLHHLPLHGWLGGAANRRSPVAVMLTPTGTPRDALPAGLSRVIVASAERELARIAEALAAAANLAPPPTELALQLAGQFAAADLAPLLALGRESRLVFIADPCTDAEAPGEAFAGALPALALTAHRYPPATWRPAAASGGPQILLIDPIALGGVEAVRALATFADLTGLEIALSAAPGSAWSARFAAHLGATLSACSQPLIICQDAMHDLGIVDGRFDLGNGAGVDWTPVRAVAERVAP